MARKTLLAGGKGFPDKPRGAPVFERARRSLRFDSQFLDQRPPFLNASLHEHPECLRCLLFSREHFKAEVGEMGSQRRIGQLGTHLPKRVI